jgi:hypothetical protein
MPVFQSSMDYIYFAHHVMRKARHLLDEQQQRFTANVLKTAKSRELTIDSGSPVWRAQLGCDYEDVVLSNDPKNKTVEKLRVPYKKERMKPLLERATEGRVNPKGIPCLYVSNDRDTAMTETRPWLGSHVSVAQLVLQTDVTVVDCTKDVVKPKLYVGGKGPQPEVVNQDVWYWINRKRPRNPS